MMNFLRDINSYFMNRPWLFVFITSILALFLITTIVLSLICPPAALAIGIGTCSLIGVILPFIALGLFLAFVLTFALSTIARFSGMFRSSTDDFVDVLSDLASVSGQKADLGKVQLENLSEHVYYTPLFVSANDADHEAQEGKLQPPRL